MLGVFVCLWDLVEVVVLNEFPNDKRLDFEERSILWEREETMRDLKGENYDFVAEWGYREAFLEH